MVQIEDDEFEEELRNSIPWRMTQGDKRSRCYVYSIYRSDDVLLYVGSTIQLKQRFTEHRSKDWWPYAAYARVTRHDQEIWAREHERALIQREPGNFQRKLYSDMRTAEPAVLDPNAEPWPIGERLFDQIRRVWVAEHGQPEDPTASGCYWCSRCRCQK